MNTEQDWRKLYTIAALETDWLKMDDRIGAAEIALKQRLHELSVDHGGTPAELRLMADTLEKLGILRADFARWRESKTQINTERAPGEPD
jgi:hypothetical protein